MAIYKQIDQENHPEYTVTVNNLANCYAEMKAFDQAEPLYYQALDIDRQQLGEDHLLYAKDLNLLAKLYQSTGQDDKAEPVMTEAFVRMKKYLNQNNGYLTEIELKKNLATFLAVLEIDQSFIYKKINTVKTDECLAYDIELFRKGILLKSVMEKRKIIMENNDTALINDFYAMIALRKRLENLPASQPEEHEETADSMKARIMELESSIAFKSNDYKRMLAENETNCADIRKNLTNDEAAVEFTSFHYFSDTRWADSNIYCAVIIMPGDPTCRMKFLFEERKLKSILPSPDADFKDIDPFYMDQMLYNLIWKPIDSLLQGINTIYFAPSGLLNSVAMAAIPCPDGNVLGEKYNLVQLSSTRTLAMPEEPAAITDAAVFGGIKYQADTTDWLASDEYRKNMMFSAKGDIQFKYADDPLLRSGLQMAGGNNTWAGQPRPEGLEDGILTAREVSNMNLLNTELVVLSACQTGQGDVKGSEGVEGLQRGFKMAGVHYLIMSLWPVPDRETTEFMDYFYDNWPGKMPIRDAFRETQLKMKRKYPNEPHKWAGFVLVE